MGGATGGRGGRRDAGSKQRGGGEWLRWWPAGLWATMLRVRCDVVGKEEGREVGRPIFLEAPERIGRGSWVNIVAHQQSVRGGRTPSL